VLRTIDGSDICYIDLGADAHVTPGLTFAVYPATGIPQDGKGKADLIVTKVDQNISECRIVRHDTANPVIAGDLIGNIVFDNLRTNTFVVEGNFDLYGSGAPTPMGTKEVINMITRYGGKVTDKLDIQTDFVVLGAEPPRPTKPKEDANSAAFAIYNAQMKAYQQYRQTRELAQSLGIPIFNTSRFLAFMGYHPQKNLEY